MNTRNDRLIDALVKDIDRHELGQYRARIMHLVAVNSTARNDLDGYPTTTPGNGATSGGGGRKMTVPDEETGSDDEVPTTATEAAAFARLEPRPADPIHDLTRRTIDALTAAANALNTVEANLRRFDNLRTTTHLEDAPQCHLARSYGLPFDPKWAPHRATDFAGYLFPVPWDEPRKVCRFTYDFTHRWYRLPTKDEMVQHLERGAVRLHEPRTTNTRMSIDRNPS